MNIVKKIKLVFLYACLFSITACSESVTLPYDLKLTNNSSYLWIVDHDGWGVLSESASIPDRNDIEVSKLLRYLEASNGLYVEIRTNKDKVWYVVLTPQDETNLGFHYNIMNLQEFETWVGKTVSSMSWKSFR